MILRFKDAIQTRWQNVPKFDLFINCWAWQGRPCYKMGRPRRPEGFSVRTKTLHSHPPHHKYFIFCFIFSPNEYLIIQYFKDMYCWIYFCFLYSFLYNTYSVLPIKNQSSAGCDSFFGRREYIVNIWRWLVKNDKKNNRREYIIWLVKANCNDYRFVFLQQLGR